MRHKSLKVIYLKEVFFVFKFIMNQTLWGLFYQCLIVYVLNHYISKTIVDKKLIWIGMIRRSYDQLHQGCS